MAKLKPIDFKFQAQAGEPLAFRSEVSVADSSGEFSLTIPDCLEELAHRTAESHRMYGVRVERPRSNLRVTGSTLDACRQFVEHVGKDYVRCEVTEDLVIVYGTHNEVAYVKDDAGGFHADGYGARDFGYGLTEPGVNGRSRWRGTLHANSRAAHFQVALTARVLLRQTYRRGSGVSVRYDWVSKELAQDKPWLKRLNSFVGLWIDAHNHQTVSRMKQMPYSEEAAQFFHDALMAMCRVADQLENCFGDAAALQLAIDRKAALLGAPATPATAPLEA